jgi:predicted aspartyl protease
MFRLILAVAASAWLAGVPLALTASAQTADAPETAAISAPVEIYRDKIMLTVRINGRDFTAAYDSGAERSVLALSAAEALGLELHGRGAAIGFGGASDLRLASDVEVELGGGAHHFDNLVVVDLAALSALFGRPVDLIIGVDIFPDSVVDIDVGGSALSFFPREGFAPPPDAVPLELDNQRNNFWATIEIGGERARANFDLGDSNALTLGPRLARRLGIDASRLPTAQVNGIGGALEVGLASVPHVRFANEDFADVPVQITTTPLPTGDANLGFPILARFRIFIDFGRERAWLAPRAELVATPFVRNLTGLRLQRSQTDRLEIVHVGRNSPAEAAGLSASDAIVAIDGAAIADWPQGADVHVWARGTEGGAARQLTLADGRTVSLTLTRFY